MLDDSDNVSVCCLLDLVDNTYTYRKHYVGICHDDEQTKIKKMCFTSYDFIVPFSIHTLSNTFFPFIN